MATGSKDKILEGGIMIDAKTQVYGLIGYPVRHSKSPAMHNAAFERLGMNAIYLCFEVRPEHLKLAVEGIRSLGIAGMNVTVPHKQAVIKYLDEITTVAERIGAVNTIFRRGDKLIGTNTDAEGFIRDLRDTCRFAARNKRCLIVGAGGGARAVCFGLADAGAKTIFIVDIDKKKSRALMRDLKKQYKAVEIKAVDHKNIPDIAPDVHLLVNATPVGMKETDPAPVDLSPFPSTTLVYDLIYSPSLTGLLVQARKRKMPYANGLGMLLQQGAVAFKHWTKVDPPLEVMAKAIGFKQRRR